jgi:hypothetical protein
VIQKGLLLAGLFFGDCTVNSLIAWNPSPAFGGERGRGEGQ